MNILEEIVENKKKEVEKRREELPLEELKGKVTGRGKYSLKESLAGGGIQLIAEIKPRSPSRGAITDLPAEEIARVYQQGIPVAVSVLTDEKYFGQDLSTLKKVRMLLDKPILRKDFIIDPYQLYEAAVAGADAVLLIANILTAEKLEELYSLAGELGLECLVEVHSEQEIKTLPLSPSIIGINNRVLDGDFSTDLEVTERLIEQVPEDSLVVSESGISNSEDVLRLHKTEQVDGVLVGTALLDGVKTSEEVSERIEKLIV
ncbi:MAG: indole-3-glycerol phosphate synthase TrpC [bacterium]